MQRVLLKVSGIVQGVGFRPFIYRIARKFSLNGYVTNDSQGVIIEFEGAKENILNAISFIKKNNPRGSVIEKIQIEEKQVNNYSNFTIKKSIKNNSNKISISPDLGICEDCINEIYDKNSRFYEYPFISCASCGPRLTILEKLPYDRPYTSMVDFDMCDKCKSEYTNPLDRRYHAQTISCHNCGPEMWTENNMDEPLEGIIRLLKLGKIIGIKGIGGYHLACDAKNDSVVKLLRERKNRHYKPFAVMMNIENVEKHCILSQFEKNLLQSPEAPIVLLRQKEDSSISKEVNPNVNTLGVMIPYTGVHKLIVDKFEALVMTSGNFSEEPIITSLENAKAKLNYIADDILYHDRRITFGCDDSVMRSCDDNAVMVRRSRGFAPSSIHLQSNSPDILACGADLKNTFCIFSKGNVYMSHHIGDLLNKHSFDRYTENIEKFKNILKSDFKYIACDYHPAYQSFKYANELGLPIIKVQHHHAHITACMAEHKLNEKVIGISFDGTGYGDDGSIWGGEIFTATRKDYNREYHFEYVKMAGGELAIEEPWRMTLSYLNSSFKTIPDIEFTNRINLEKSNAIINLLKKGYDWPYTSSAGRLFDAVSSLLGIRDINSYEGQAAIELEAIVSNDNDRFYNFKIINDIIYTNQLIKEIVYDIKKGIPNSIISSKFHNTISQIILESSDKIRDKTGIKKVVLGGGVFQNITLLRQTINKLTSQGFEVYYNNFYPINDGGISLGQITTTLEYVKQLNSY